MILKNAEIEGPGTMGDFLRRNGVPYRVVDLSRGEDLPGLGSFASLVVLGGPMAVYEMERYPFIGKAAHAISEALGLGMRVLGVCLGAQLMAHCLGARVYRGGAGQEIGWMDIELTGEGLKDPVMGELARGGTGTVKVFQWHGDTFDLPAGAVRLAGSAKYENQAFRFREGAYALQFHVEADPGMIMQWFSGDEEVPEGLEEQTAEYAAGCSEAASGLYRKFFLAG